jgi:hypothetical protein
LKASSQDALRESKIPLEFAETAHSIERIAKDEKRPAVAHDLKRPRDWALLSLRVLSTFHHFLTCLEKACFLAGLIIELVNVKFNWFDLRTRLENHEV